MSFRNRCILPGANGKINLTVPVLGGREQKSPLKDIRIDYKTNWQKIHWRTIFSVYGNSPWFEFFYEELEAFYCKKFEFLTDLNEAAFQWVSQKLGIQIPVITNGSAGQDKIVDMRNQILPSNFQDGSSGPFPVYPQVFKDKTGFEPNMSILDLIFCEGKRAPDILREYAA